MKQCKTVVESKYKDVLKVTSSSKTSGKLLWFDPIIQSNHIEIVTDHGLLFDWDEQAIKQKFPNEKSSSVDSDKYRYDVYSEIIAALAGSSGWTTAKYADIYTDAKDTEWFTHGSKPDVLIRKKGSDIIAVCGFIVDHKFRSTALVVKIYASNTDDLEDALIDVSSERMVDTALENLQAIVETLNEFESKKEILALVRKDPSMAKFLNGCDDATCVAKLESIL